METKRKHEWVWMIVNPRTTRYTYVNLIELAFESVVATKDMVGLLAAAY